MTDWRQQGNCSDIPPAKTDPWFFPLGVWQGPNESRAGYAKALALCIDCPVQDACLEAAMTEEGPAAAGNRYGMRGGMTPNQRRLLWESRQEGARFAAQLGAAS